jgi:hypothetical protein
LPWEYTKKFWEEDKVHHSEINYDIVTFKRQHRPLRRIVDENKVREEAKNKVEEEVVERASPASSSAHSGLVEEEETLVDKKRKRKK